MRGFLNTFFLIIFLFIFACGFKAVKQGELINFKIVEIKASGDKRINYKIKNKLISSASQAEKKLINVNLNTKKTKSVKEKNIKNEIQKYQIDITTKVEFSLIGSDFSKRFTVSDNRQFNAKKQHSITLRNEKKAIDQLSDKLSNKILNQIIENLNDI